MLIIADKSRKVKCKKTTRMRYEKIHMDAAGGGGQPENNRPGSAGRRSDTGAGHLPGGVDIGERYDCRTDFEIHTACAAQN